MNCWLVATQESDLDFVLAAEGEAAHRAYVLAWSRDRHRRAIEHPDEAHFLVQTDAGRRSIGYLILAGLASPNRSVELVRIVITEKGQGFGRQALRLALRWAFEERRAHRFWLDVMEHNDRARSLYLSEGFVIEGRCRDALLLDGRYISLDLLSILEAEYRQLQAVRETDGNDGQRLDRSS